MLVSFGLGKTRLMDSINVTDVSLNEMQKNVASDAETLLKQTKGLYEHVPSDASVLFSDIELCKTKALTQLATVAAGTPVALRKDAEAVDSRESILELGVRVKQLGFGIKKGDVNTFNDLKGKLNKHISNATRIRARQATVPADNVDAQSCPFWSALRALAAVNVSPSIFEAKAGVRGCTVPVTTDVCESLRNNMVIKQSIKKVKKFAMQTGNPWLTTACAPDELKGTALLKLIQKGLDMNCCTRHILPDETWATKLQAVRSTPLTNRRRAMCA